MVNTFLLYRHEYFTGKCTTRKIDTKPHPGLQWRIFHILTSEDIDDFADIKGEIGDFLTNQNRVNCNFYD